MKAFRNPWIGIFVLLILSPALSGEEINITKGSHDTHRDFWFGPLEQDPVITLNPQSLTFVAQQQGDNPEPQDVTVSNSGDGTLDSITTNHEASSWLSLTKNGTGNLQVLTNHIDITGLDPGTYNMAVEVSAPNAPTSASYDITLTVNPKPDGDNTAPIVDAGADQTIALGQMASLDGTVSDDGLPSGGNLTIQWAKTSGPGLATFTSPNDVSTDVSLAVAGTYVLTLSANDGELESSDDVSITVQQGEGSSVTLIAPNGGERWEVGSTQHIRWNVVDVSDVTIRYSVDNGQTWEMISSSVDDKSENWLDFQWTVADMPTDQAIVRISDYFQETLGDQSDAVFTICAAGQCESHDGGGGGGDSGDIELVGAGCSCSTAGSDSTASIMLFLLLSLLASVGPKGR